MIGLRSTGFSLRERLAVARANSRFDVCAASAFGDPLGNLLLRGLDNGDLESLLSANRLLVELMRGPIGHTRANAMAASVLRYMLDSRCDACSGRQFIRQGAAVKACSACNGMGHVGTPPQWHRTQLRVLWHAQAAIGRALSEARARLVAD